VVRATLASKYFFMTAPVHACQSLAEEF
jgi:hypothetical protein